MLCTWLSSEIQFKSNSLTFSFSALQIKVLCDGSSCGFVYLKLKAAVVRTNCFSAFPKHLDWLSGYPASQYSKNMLDEMKMDRVWWPYINKISCKYDSRVVLPWPSQVYWMYVTYWECQLSCLWWLSIPVFTNVLIAFINGLCGCSWDKVFANT
jgi:hypothetical protein